MEFEKEITILLTCSFEEIDKILIEKGFKIVDKYDMVDVYMLHKDIDIQTTPNLEILKSCVLIRNIVNIRQELLYKYKEYDENGDILKQGKAHCPITNPREAKAFMEAINYQELFIINDSIIVYSDSKIELAVQQVNDKYLFIELEDHSETVDREYKDTDEMKEHLDSYNLPYKKDNYFVKKAEILLEEIKNK